MIAKNFSIIIIYFSVFFVSSRCGYKFYDASIPPEVKTIRINNFLNNASLVNPNLALQLTNGLIDKIQNQTKLFLINKGKADYEIGGTVTEYTVSSSNISGATVTKNMLKIVVNYSFLNNIEELIPEIKSREIEIPKNEEFDATKTLADVEKQLVDRMVQQLTNDAFNKIFSSW